MSTLPSLSDLDQFYDLVKNLNQLPSYDRNRFETLDGYDNPNCNNLMRAGFTIEALAVFQKACHMNEEPNVAVSDLICDLLHLVHSLDFNPKNVLENALTNFLAEAG